MFLQKFLQIILWLPAKILLPTKVVGKKNLVKGGAIYACNHQSSLDIPTLSLNLVRKQHYLAKMEYFKKGKKSFLYRCDAIPINRENPDLSSIKKCLQLLKEDKIITIFPEGTRKNKYPLENFKAGIAIFAIKSQKPVIPMWIVKKPKILRFNTLKIGEPLYFNEFIGKKLSDDVIKNAESKIYYGLKQLSIDVKKLNKKNLNLV